MSTEESINNQSDIKQEELKAGASDQTVETIETIDLEAVEDLVNNVEANSIVKNHIIASMTLGLVPVPLFDLAALTMTQMNMLRSLSEHYEVEFDDMSSKSLVTSLISGSLPVMGVLGLSSVTKLIPGIGTLAGSASLSLMAGSVTYAVGKIFIQHFEEGGTLEDFEAKKVQVYFQQELKNGKEFVKSLKESQEAEKPAEVQKTETN